MSVTLAVLTTDGRRECIEATIASADENLQGDVVDRVIFADADPDYTRWLAIRFPSWWVRSTGEKAGYAAAMRQAYKRLDTAPGPVFWLEDDFTFNRPVDLDAMAAVLEANPRFAQLALRRQPWNEHERAAGGIVEQHPDWYEDLWLTEPDGTLHPVLAHDGYFTNNPSLVQRWVFDIEYPEGKDAEGRFTFAIKAARPDARFAYWGARDSGEAVEHIGAVQARGAF